MNPDQPLTPREELEIRITAMLMGELSPEESADLQKQIDGDPELIALHARLRQAVELLREASAIPEQPAPPVPAQLSSERREKLLAHFKAPAPAASAVIVRPRREWRKFVPLGLAASLIALVGGTLFMAEYFMRGNLSVARKLRTDVDELMADEAESRWDAQPGAVRNLHVDANGRASGTASNGTNWMFWRKAPAQERGETAEPLADVSLAAAGDSLAANNGEFDVSGAVRRSVRFAQPGLPAAQAPVAAEPAPAPATQLFARAGGASNLALNRGFDEESLIAAKSDAPPARMPIYLGTESENAVAENAPAARPEIAAFNAPAPLAAFKLYSASEMKTAQPAPAADAFGNGVVNGGVSGSLSVGGKVQLPQGVAAVRGSTSAPRNWDRGLSKHMDGTLGDKVDDGNVVIANGVAPDAPILSTAATFTGGVQLPQLAGLAPSAETKPAAPDASKPADSKRGRGVQWMESDGDGIANISGDKSAPVSGPAPAEPAVSPVLARS